MPEQFLTTEFMGQLANQVLTLFKLLRFAKLMNIPMNQVIVNGSVYGCSGINPRKYGKKCEKGFLLNRIDFFSNISSVIVDEEEWERRTQSVSFVDCKEDEKKAIAAWTNGDSVRLGKNLLYPATGEERKLIKEWFLNETLYNQAKQELIDQGIDPTSAVALHIRRTDFQDYHDGQYLLTKEQINDSIKEVPPENQLVIFSDDMKWCKENIFRSKGEIIFNNPGTDTQDLLRLAACSKLIKNPGSSFSNLAGLLHK